MWAFIGLTFILLLGVLYYFAELNRQDVLKNWEMYNKNPLFIFFLAPFYKPDGDNRSRFEFAVANFINVLSTFASNTMKEVMQPVMVIFKMLTDAVDETVNGLFNVRGLLKVMWSRFNSMTAVFMNRFQATLTALRATFMKLHSAIGKTFAIAASGIMSGLIAVQTTFSVFDLVVNIILTILTILAAIFIWLPFLLIPVIALIIMTVRLIEQSGQGDKVTGMAGVFCFEEGTQVITATGVKAIEMVQLGEQLVDGGIVNGTFIFEQETDDMYNLEGVHVSGEHIVFQEGIPIFVKNHPDARKLVYQTRKVYCFLTSNRRIPVMSDKGVITFADWEELENNAEQLGEWNKRVFGLLNPNKPYSAPNISSIMSESGVTAHTQVLTPLGPVEIRGIYPGYRVFDATGKPTKVNGVVRLANTEIADSVALGTTARMSVGTWIKTNNVWTQVRVGAQGSQGSQGTEEWYQLFTEAGTFQVVDGTQIHAVRDFTDVGSAEIHKTYNWVLEQLAQKI